MKPTVAEMNCETGETSFREMTDEEYTQHLADKAAHEAEMEDNNPA